MKNTPKSFSPGDLLVEHGIVYEVIEVKDQPNFNGKIETFIKYKPYFDSNRNRGLIRSTPVGSLGMTNLRRPISRQKAEQILTTMATHPDEVIEINQKSAREVLNSNAIGKIAHILQCLWAERIDTDKKDLSLTKKTLINDAIDTLVEELSVVLGISLDESREVIMRRLTEMNV